MYKQNTCRDIIWSCPFTFLYKLLPDEITQHQPTLYCMKGVSSSNCWRLSHCMQPLGEIPPPTPWRNFLNTALLVDCLDGRTIHITTMIVIYIRQLVLNTAYSWARHTKRWNTCIANQRIIRGHSQAIYSLKGWALHKIAQCFTRWNITCIRMHGYDEAIVYACTCAHLKLMRTVQ